MLNVLKINAQEMLEKVENVEYLIGYVMTSAYDRHTHLENMLLVSILCDDIKELKEMANTLKELEQEQLKKQQ